ncbi:MAG: IS1595 family transposase [Devosia sp.]
MNLTAKIFNDEAAAEAHIIASRWADGLTCPHCGSVNAMRMAGKTQAGMFLCRDCRDKFTCRTGTVMERSHIPLHKWLLALHLMASSKKGISALQLQRNLGLGSYRTAWFLAMRCREAMGLGPEAGPMGGPGEVVEADSSFIGGKESNKHASKRAPKGTTNAGIGKQIVHTLVERGGAARSHHLPNITNKTLKTVLFKNVSRKSTLATDKASGYRFAGRQFAKHEQVDHGKGEYVRGDAYSNTVEGYFAILKRGIFGVFHSVSEQHLSRYLKEFDFRYSNRSALGVEDTERAARALEGTVGKRLMYSQPRKAAHA